MDVGEVSEIYISVDVETAGPYPPQYSLLSVGACTLPEPRHGFHVDLKPINDNAQEEALSIHRLSLAQLKEHGVKPAEAMRRFEVWLAEQTPAGTLPVFVAFNAPFDWSFVNYYFHHYLRHNPFGHSALDIKAFYMGMSGVPWLETSMRFLGPRYLKKDRLAHHALQDALDQAEIFQNLLAESGSRIRESTNLR